MTKTETKTVVEFNDVSFSYDRHLILEDIHWTVEGGDFVGVIGPNGSGKTTLIKLMLGLIKPDRGSIKIFDTSVRAGRIRIGYVPQIVHHNREFPITVADVVAMGDLGDGFWGFMTPQKTRQRVMAILNQLQMADIAQRKFGDLSLGQKQRCFIARALVSDPELIILDEPTASVDNQVEQDIFRLLKKIQGQRTVIIISHDLGFISQYVNKVACVNQHLVAHRIEDMNQKVIDSLYQSKMTMVSHQCEH